ncbi:MAG TPA: MBL fold metallo-hydrolase [Candidatus Limnocylindrales bacterium]|nr:MBL fold metallo-hydrolase [Candidatus Limnocylindrales bacterium]
MLRQIADGVLVHESEFLQSNAVVVQGSAGVLVVDPGIRGDELTCLATDISGLGQTVVAGFATHPHWDHVLWHPQLGAAPRYGTARSATVLREQLTNPQWMEEEAAGLPPELAGLVPLELFGLLAGLPEGAAELPWDGPRVRIIEHQAHAPGHAALLIEERRALVAGDMLSNILIPMPDFSAADPLADYLVGLRQLEAAAADVDAFVPGHGSVGRADELRERIELDRAYVQALRDGTDAADPRLEPSAPNGEWLPDVHEWQRQQVGPRRR